MYNANALDLMNMLDNGSQAVYSGYGRVFPYDDDVPLEQQRSIVSEAHPDLRQKLDDHDEYRRDVADGVKAYKQRVESNLWTNVSDT